jgi:hypothetical protein
VKYLKKKKCFNHDCLIDYIIKWNKEIFLGDIYTFHYQIFKNKSLKNSKCYQKNEDFYFCNDSMFYPCYNKLTKKLKFRNHDIFKFSHILQKEDLIFFKKKLNFHLTYLKNDTKNKLLLRTYVNNKVVWKTKPLAPYHSCNTVCNDIGMKCNPDLGHFTNDCDELQNHFSKNCLCLTFLEDEFHPVIERNFLIKLNRLPL